MPTGRLREPVRKMIIYLYPISAERSQATESLEAQKVEGDLLSKHANFWKYIRNLLKDSKIKHSPDVVVNRSAVRDP